MNISTIVALVLNGLFAIILLFGFLIGLKRGWKKATLRFGVLVAIIAVVAIVSPYITKALLEMQISQLGCSVMEYIQNAIAESEELSTLFALESTAAYLNNIIVVLCNLVVFIVLNIVASIFSWIIYKIIARICFKKNKAKVLTEKDKEKIRNKEIKVNTPVLLTKKKEHKWIGGLVGIVHAFVIMFVLFLPISGVVNLALDVVGETSENESTTLAETDPTIGGGLTDEELPETLGDMVRSYIDYPEVWEIVNVYQKSAMPVISGVFGFDDACFNSIASMNVKGEKVVLRQDVLSLNTLYNKAAPLYNKYYINGETNDWSNMPIEDIKAIVDTMLDISTIRALANDAFEFGLIESIYNNDDFYAGEYTAEIKQLAKDIYDSYKSYDNVTDGIKEDIHYLLDIVKILQDSDGLAHFQDFNKIASPTEAQVKDFYEQLVESLKKVEGTSDSSINRIIDKLFSSPRVDVIIKFGLNILDDKLNEQLGLSGDDAIQFTSTAKISSQKADIKLVVNAMLDCVDDIIDSDFEDFSTVKFDGIGEALNTIKNIAYKNGNENTSSIFLPFYKGAINYLCSIEDYGEVITDIVKNTDGTIKDINWKSLANLVQAGMAMQDGVNADNVNNLLDAIKENPELTENASDFVETFTGSTLTPEQKDAVDNVVETLTGDELTEEEYDVVGEVLADLSKVQSGEEVTPSDVAEKINSLAEITTDSSNLAQEIVDAVEVFAGSEGITVSEENKPTVVEIINGITDAELKAQLEALLNLTSD